MSITTPFSSVLLARTARLFDLWWMGLFFVLKVLQSWGLCSNSKIHRRTSVEELVIFDDAVRSLPTWSSRLRTIFQTYHPIFEAHLLLSLSSPAVTCHSHAFLALSLSPQHRNQWSLHSYQIWLLHLSLFDHRILSCCKWFSPSISLSLHQHNWY